MVDRRSTRVWWKRVLLLSRVKLIYARITLTKFTTAYFFFAIISCIGIAILQSQTFFSNSEGVLAISQFLAQGNVTTSTVGISFLADGNVFLCQNLPLQTGSNCSILVKHVKSHMRVREIDATFHLGDLAESQTIEERAEPDLHQCAVSLMWLHDVLTDAKREDLTILAYQLWLISMSVVTLLNESLPHLFAGLAARVLGTAWAGFRVQGSINLYSTYLHVVKSGPCRGFDPLNSWWDESEAHEIAGLVSNAVTLLAIAALTFKLFRVYASQSFSRVGTSTEINRVYKLVLVLSVLLQLAGFFTLAQTILWISKISFGSIGKLADHFQIYFAALVVTAVLEVPWLILGWITVRKEQRLRFLVFCFISFGLLLIASLMFASPLYRFVFSAWAFYATITVTSYALIVTTSIVAILCRLQFGKGLKHFLRVTEALDDGDFTPVYFSKVSLLNACCVLSHAVPLQERSRGRYQGRHGTRP
ncbi:hypothetical protein C8J57DRAFT_152354 [Mycena rebaudengoi]|nr:hypothetical protein C8J57DRAFT_152354 [Mycena rebaudengoi]